MCKIYIIKNTINNKIYVGQTWNTLEKRFNQHKSTNKCIKLHNALNKHGRDNFSIELIAECSNQEVADYLEITYIAEYDSVKNGYNCRDGGSAGKHTQESKKKISNSHKGMSYSDETKKKISKYRKGKLLSNETKLKITNSLIGKMAGNKHPMFGKKCTKLTIEFINDLISQYTNDGITQRELSIKYNLSKGTIWNIIHNKIEGI